MTDTLPITQDPEVLAAKGAALTIADQARALEIVDEPTYNIALSVLAQCRKAGKRFDDLKKKWTAPLKQQVKDQCGVIERDLDEMAAPAREADAVLTAKTNAWRLKVAELARKAQEHDRLKQERAHERAVERAEAKGVEPPPMSPVLPTYAPPAKTVETADGSRVTFTRRFHMEIEDASLLPREYLVPDEVKIRKVASAGIQIPGVRSWYTEEPSVY